MSLCCIKRPRRNFHSRSKATHLCCFYQQWECWDVRETFLKIKLKHGGRGGDQRILTSRVISLILTIIKWMVWRWKKLQYNWLDAGKANVKTNKQNHKNQQNKNTEKTNKQNQNKIRTTTKVSHNDRRFFPRHRPSKFFSQNHVSRYNYFKSHILFLLFS